ncbi:deSI-like protein At4g17486 [Dendrobium catenatum]|uniref:DeSI-like protein n=1 Tax=Dendrobium catenatum TaxID=906689 RepID=A0A2I0VUJ9_9ASPA|nr:deSI-like protein At4g17486 [Dendrobium catenatum]PKU67069.1 DeSI-like protein [Dendrobium catenatum]
MGAVFSSGSSGEDESSNGVPVILNVYDLTPLNNYLYWCGLGIFHSGIEVHGLEYGFGAHDFPTSGVFEVEPRNCPGFVYRCSLLLGYINMPPLEFRTFMESMSAEYYGDTYHLISKNCNHFTEDLCLRLTRQQIPGWINRLARLGATCNCLLPESLRLPSVKELPDYHVLSEDSSESVAFIGSHEPMDSDDTDTDKHLLSQSLSGEVTVVKEIHR